MSKKHPLGKPLFVHMTEGRRAANAAAKRGPDARRIRRFGRQYPDDCECDARDRKTCAQNCAPLPWPAVGVSVGRWNVKRKYGGKLQDKINQLANIRNAIYHHPHDFHIGMVVYWVRDRKVRSGVVVKVLDDDYKPAVVRSAGHPRRYEYKPTIYAYCDAEGRKPCVCDLPIGKRTACQQQKHCPIRSGDADRAALGHGRDTEMYDGPPGVKLMQSHSPAALAGVRNPQMEAYTLGMVLHNAKVKPDMVIRGSIMGPDEYATRGGPDDFSDGGRPVPWQFQIAEYEVRESRKGNGQWGIYLRNFNMRLATFSDNSFALRDALSRGFDAAHVLKKKRATDFKAKPRKKK